MSGLKDGCVKPAAGPIFTGQTISDPGIAAAKKQEANTVVVKVGKEAVDFEASAFVTGKGFKPVKLSDYKGKWIVLCFYPGDFTYV